jgi:hypothetical protein
VNPRQCSGISLLANELRYQHHECRFGWYFHQPAFVMPVTTLE